MDARRYEFELSFWERDDGIELIAQCGTGQGRVVFPAELLEDSRLEQMLARFERNRLVGEEVRELGDRLFNLMLPPALEKLFAAARMEAGSSLIVRIRGEGAAAAMPWEVAYDSRRRVFLALDPTLSMIRSTPVATPTAALKGADSLRMLVALSSPAESPALDLAGEREALEEALADALANGQVVMEVVERPVTMAKLADALAAGAYDVLHFVGYGNTEMVSLEDEEGLSRPVSGEQLQTLLQGQRLRLVVVSSAGSAGYAADQPGPAISLARSGTPLVLGLQSLMTETAAVFFDHAFYVGIAEGLPVEQAVAHARRRTYLEFGDRADWVAPVLYASGSLPEPLLYPRQRAEKGAMGQQVVSNVGSLVGVKTGDYYGGSSKLNVQQQIYTLDEETSAEGMVLELGGLEKGIPAIGGEEEAEEPPAEALFEGVVGEGAEGDAVAPAAAGGVDGPVGSGADGDERRGSGGAPGRVAGPVAEGRVVQGRGTPLVVGEQLEAVRAAVIGGPQTPRQKIEALALIEEVAFALEDGKRGEALLLLQQVADASKQTAEGAARLKAEIEKMVGG